MDEGQFTLAVRQYQALLWHIAYAMLRSEQDAADAVQEALLLAWRGRNCLHSETAVRAWLTRILINACKKTLRKRNRTVLTELHDLAAPPEVDNQPLHDALARLKPEWRMPIVLYYLEGFSVAEVASALRIPAGTVKSRLSKGRELLKGMLRREDFE